MRCKTLDQDQHSMETQGHLDDRVYRLHILRAMARPCYIMACYSTVGERAHSTAGRQTDRQDSTLSAISNFSWRKESIMNLASVVGADSVGPSKHSLVNPLDKQFRTEADCRIHHECNCPVSRCFSLKTMADSFAQEAPEYREEYKEVAASVEHFSASILSQCRDASEVKVFLLHSFLFQVESLLMKESNEGLKGTESVKNLKGTHVHCKFPILRMAVEMGQKEFVGHMYSQQVLTQQWVGRSGWGQLGALRKLLHMVLQLLLTPLLCLGFLVRAAARTLLCRSRGKVAVSLLGLMDSSYAFNSLDSPINRCISHVSSLAIIIGLVIFAIFRPISRCPKADKGFQGLYPARIWLIVMVSSCIVKELEDFMTVRSFKIYFKFDFWRIYRIINEWIILLAIGIQTHVEYRIFEKENVKSYEAEHDFSDAMFAFATTVSVIHLLYWMQLHNTMGPIVISVSKVVMDVFTIGCMYVIVLLAFSSGIVFMGSENIKNEQCTQILNRNKTARLWPNISELYQTQNYKVLQNILKTTETLFWALLGPGQEFKENIPKDVISKQGTFSLVLMASYQIISAVIMMNLLIAIMNTTLEIVQDKKLLYWKFVRAGIWIRFFDDSRALPPPYNLFNICTYVFNFVEDRLRPRSYAQTSIKGESDGQKARLARVELTKELLHRYAADNFNMKEKEKAEDLS